MPNPTRQEILDAYNTLEALCARLPATRAAKASILAALPPKPKPTMAEIKWDDDKHYLAEAEHPDFGKVIMLGKSWVFEQIDILVNNDQGISFQLEYPADLTPTGRRYTLTEVQDG